MKKFVIALVASVTAVFGFGMVANAYPPGAPSPEVSDPTPAVGARFTVEVGCSPIGASVEFTLNSTPVQIATVTCVARGSARTTDPVFGVARTTFTAPKVAGAYEINFTGAAVGATSITVQAAPAIPNGDLPGTGSNGVGPMTLVALGLLGIGAGLFAVSQVRRRQTV